MVECPRCGNEAESVAEAFVLVWCSFCADLIEVGGLDLHAASARVADGAVTIPPLTAVRDADEEASHEALAPATTC